MCKSIDKRGISVYWICQNEQADILTIYLYNRGENGITVLVSGPTGHTTVWVPGGRTIIISTVIANDEPWPIRRILSINEPGGTRQYIFYPHFQRHAFFEIDWIRRSNQFIPNQFIQEADQDIKRFWEAKLEDIIELPSR